MLNFQEINYNYIKSRKNNLLWFNPAYLVDEKRVFCYTNIRKSVTKLPVLRLYK